MARALIFHPGPDGTVYLGMTREPTFAVDLLPTRAQLAERYAKFQRGESDKPVHEFFGPRVDVLLDTATSAIDGEES
jgi:hypothetical protein